MDVLRTFLDQGTPMFYWRLCVLPPGCLPRQAVLNRFCETTIVSSFHTLLWRRKARTIGKSYIFSITVPTLTLHKKNKLNFCFIVWIFMKNQFSDFWTSFTVNFHALNKSIIIVTLSVLDFSTFFKNVYIQKFYYRLYNKYKTIILQFI